MKRRLATLGMLLVLGAGPAMAQPLVITPLPSDQVIEAVEAPVLQAAPQAAPVIALPPEDAPRRAGLPQPSIIVGDMAALAGLDPRGPLGLPFAARETIRQRDGALFDRLLGRGAFDPDDDRLAEAIQTELSRMECYSGGIDGAWGAGSGRAVERWEEAADTDAGNDPQMPLFRAIARSANLRCAAVAAPVAQPARTTPARATPARTTPARAAGGQAAPARQTARQPAQPAQSAPAAPRQINPSLMGSGQFR